MSPTEELVHVHHRDLVDPVFVESLGHLRLAEPGDELDLVAVGFAEHDRHELVHRQEAVVVHIQLHEYLADRQTDRQTRC